MVLFREKRIKLRKNKKIIIKNKNKIEIGTKYYSLINPACIKEVLVLILGPSKS